MSPETIDIMLVEVDTPCPAWLSFTRKDDRRLPLGVELELAAAAGTTLAGLLLYRPLLRAQVRGRSNVTDIYVSAIMLTGTALLLGVAVGRPLLLLLSG